MQATTRLGGDARLGLVVGAAIGYGYDEVVPFVASFRQAGYEGAILLIMAKSVAPADIHRLEAHRVTVVRVRTYDAMLRSEHFFVRATRVALRSLGTAAAVSLQPPAERRWLLYGKIRRTHRELFDDAPWVFVCDVRDVHAQADPSPIFRHLVEHAPIHLYTEGSPHATVGKGTMGIGDQSHNANWIRYLGGDETLSRLAHRPILCSGTVLLTQAPLAEFCKRMVRTMATHRLRGALWGLDQGALNLLYHTGALDDLSPIVHANGAGGVITLQLCPPELLTITDGHLSVNGANPAVVHQYDRIPALDRAWSGGPDTSASASPMTG